MRAPVPCLLLVASAALLPGVEPALNDLRLVVEARPTAYRFDWDGAGASRQGDDRLERAGSAGIGWRWAATRPGRPAALLLGLEAVGQYDSGPRTSRTGAALRAEAGLAYGLHNRLLLTCAPVAGYGLGTWRVAGGPGPDADLSGRQMEVGLRTGLRWNLDPRWSIGLEGAWWWSHERADGGGGILTIDRSGPAVLLSLAWTIDPTTRRME